MKRHLLGLLLALNGATLVAAESQTFASPARSNPRTSDIANPTPVGSTETPAAVAAGPVEFDYMNSDGLYATVTSMTCFKKPDIKDEKKLKLKKIDGFKKDIEVRALIQDKPAPLVVVFLGLASKSKDPLARLWQSQLYEAGNHVLVFDSVFRSSFNECSCHGVAGNLEVEARVAARVIHAFSQHPLLEDKVTKLGLVGASYGGILALNYAKLAKAGEIRLKPDRVLVFSPPTNMQVSAKTLDSFYAEYQEKYGLFDLLKMSGHEPVESGKKIPFSPGQMRAGIGYVFHADLKDAISCSKEVYNFELPDEKGKKKWQNAFTRFIEEVVYPYWNKQGTVRSLEDLWQYGDLYRLLKNNPENVHCVLTEDDPLNDPKLLEYLKRDIPRANLTVLPRGGHLGFLGCNWAKARIQSLFE